MVLVVAPWADVHPTTLHSAYGDLVNLLQGPTATCWLTGRDNIVLHIVIGAQLSSTRSRIQNSIDV